MRPAVLLLALAACKNAPAPNRGPLEDMVLDHLGPSTLLPGTTVVLHGDDFLPELAGPSELILAKVELDAVFVDYQTMEATWPGGTPGPLAGRARVETQSSYDGQRHASNELSVSLTVAETLTPALDALEGGGSHVNDRFVVRGAGLLLGRGEGETLAVVEGCFRRQGAGSCNDVGPVEVPTTPLDPLDRTAASFLFAPEIVGIEPGTFEGQVHLLNRHAGGAETTSGSVPLQHTIDPPRLSGIDPGAASLGQIVTMEGAGFVGPGPGDPAAVTLIELDGRYSGTSVVVTLVGELQDGNHLRYVLNEEDALGRIVDLRSATGTFVGTARPIVAFGNDTVEGNAVPVELGLRPVKQVVWLKRQPSFVESLRQFGLRNAQDAVADRIVSVVARDFAGVNLEVRLDEPDDFALYSIVELSGPDPNGLGLLGYDNTPGKDVGNLRLYDTIGGVNALTQLDGYPGYGGVFIDSLFAYSAHPPSRLADEGLTEPLFDELFDPTRPDVKGGKPVSEAEAADLLAIADNTTCPGSGRQTQASCAVFALGSLVGTTVSHEIAHSLGLADPEGKSFHNTGDWEDAIMDGGSSRTFAERAEVDGKGPGAFCQVNYDYLRDILPTADADPVPERQDCY